MKITAPAKLNLFLHITGRRDDGYHLLESLFAFTELSDEISIQASDQFSLTIDGPYSQSLSHEPIEKNLVYRATQLIKTLGIKDSNHNVAIHITKNIPVGAGLGGGSSDAAAVLTALNHHWNLGLSDDRLATMGLTLGADVPACLYQKTAMVSGIGENITPISIALPPFVLLINPNQLLSTKAVFQHHHQQHYSPAQLNKPTSFEDILKKRNDLTTAAITLLPNINMILETVSQLPGCVLSRMSGSGPTCFALFNDENAANEAEKRVRAVFPTYWIRRTTLR